MTRRKDPPAEPRRPASHRPGVAVLLSCGHEFVSWGYTPSGGDRLWCRTCDAPSSYPGKPATVDEDPP
jgi:hypothetical protein